MSERDETGLKAAFSPPHLTNKECLLLESLVGKHLAELERRVKDVETAGSAMYAGILKEEARIVANLHSKIGLYRSERSDAVPPGGEGVPRQYKPSRI